MLDEDPAPLYKKGGGTPPIFGPFRLWPNGAEHPRFSAHVDCGQTAGWIKIALGMEVGLGSGHIVLDGDPAPPKKAPQPPQFSAYV